MSSIRSIVLLGFLTVALFGFAYPLLMVGIGRAMGEAADGFPIYRNDTLIGYDNVGQPFDGPTYFWSRPSAVGYNAASAGGSNYGPTNPDFLAEVKGRVDTLLAYHPGLEARDIPVELVTASGGGLDPHISAAGGLIQVERVARARGIAADRVRALVEDHVEGPWLGLFGPGDRVNVLKLNLALDELSAPTAP